MLLRIHETTGIYAVVRYAQVNILMGESSWWSEATACYHEPKVHDHELYFQLTSINLYVLLPLAIFGIFFNASALVRLYKAILFTF